MKCKACLYSDQKDEPFEYRRFTPFIEIFIKTESFEGAKSETNRRLFACPFCGTLKIEVKE